MLLGEGERREAEVDILLPHGAAPALGLGHEFLARLEVVALGRQTLDRVLEQALFVGKFEVHSYPSLADIPAERSEGRNP